MAEFQEVMKQWRRMCNACSDNTGCHKECPLYNIVEGGCGAIYEESFADVVDFAELNRRVDQWAAEHPEPVYPTWYAWLANNGVVPIELHPDEAMLVTEIGLLKQIPACIAEKYGIQPKEGV